MSSFIKSTINCVFVHVNQLQRSAEWYSRLLGLKVLDERLNGGPVYWMELDRYTGLILDDNSVNIARGEWSKEKAPLFMYKTKSVPLAYDELQKKGIKITLKIETPQEGLTFFNFEDPDGNVFMVCSADEDNVPIEKVAPSPIHNSIPAVFVNVTDIHKAAEWHFDLLGLEQRPMAPKETILEIKNEKGANILLDYNRHLNGEDFKVLFMFGTDNINEAYSFVNSNNIKVFTEIEEHRDVSFFTILDPDDHVIMICQSHKETE
ncbi:VOC family protein [Alkalihalobacillus sp. BA299]|uniref:VOC family protein n=1 Tax=Alkalihalobacillus sp. BA299 TaxID=2815938 RepID=UPI001ADAA199|nr:VOC family protein [Alkalihalobacillus sp. BA299]